MKKNKFMTAICVLSTFVGANLQAKETKTKKVSNTNSSNKNSATKKSSITTHNTRIYSISSKNTSPLLETKMAELKQRHAKVMASGSAQEKRKVNIEKKLLTSYSKWKGTKYKLGGDSKEEIDCSALTHRVYRETFNQELPRVSTQQIKKGPRVAGKDLKSGDIMYFRPDNRIDPTAVYVGNSIFINASSSKGVVVSSLKIPYWRKYFKYGVRAHKA